MRLRRHLAACAIPALFVALVVICAPLASSHQASSAPSGASHRAVVTGEAPLAPITAATAELSRRVVAFGALIAYLAVAFSLALALLFGRARSRSSWVLLPRPDLTKRGRAPPFARA